MKILHVAFSINPAYGGIPQYVLSLVKKQNEHGIVAHLCSTTSNLNNTYLKKNFYIYLKKIYLILVFSYFQKIWLKTGI